MVLLTELLLTVSMTTAAFALVVTPTPEPDWDKLVNESLQSSSSAREYFSVQSSSCLAHCPPGWATYGRRCFKYIDQSMDWDTAEAHCVNLDAHLVSIHNENENKMVKALIRAYDPAERPTWIGLNSCKKHNWFWTDGTKFVYNKWNLGEPSHHEGECCVQTNWKGFYSPEKDWNDFSCNNQYPFVCVKSLV